jgi:hypothetical protein
VGDVDAGFSDAAEVKSLGVFPKWEFLKNKSRKSGVFFEPEK